MEEKADPGSSPGDGEIMKPMSVGAMVIFLIIIVLMIIYLRPHG